MQSATVTSELNGRENLFLGNLEIRPAELQVLADGVHVPLTVREFQILFVLAENAEHVVTRPEIYRQVWKDKMSYRDRSVDVFVRKVRHKLRACSPEWDYIHTHFAIGYRFDPQRKAD